jgi:4-diphosphocytidyl-2-C-methyl-D-erythritol kinase
MSHARAFAKINLGLVVGPVREDGKHELLTLLQRIELHDDITLEPAKELAVDGFPGDTIVRAALVLLGRTAGVEPHWRVHIDKQIPVAAGLGGGSTDAASALSLANSLLPRPLAEDALHEVAVEIGVDVPFFLRAGAQLGTADGTTLTTVTLPSDYYVVLLVPAGESKQSTASVYESFDARDGARGFDRRAQDFRDALASVGNASDLRALPPNDLASSPLTEDLEAAGAFRADVSGAGPAVYGLFERLDEAVIAARALERRGVCHLTRPVAD